MSEYESIPDENELTNIKWEQDTAMPVAPADPASSAPFWRAIPVQLELVDGGKVVQELYKLREKYEENLPNEIYLLLNPAEVGAAAEEQFAHKAHKIEGWRNSLILLPIMITWISLGLAGVAYTQSVTQNAKLIAEPFLKQWTDGFPTLKQITIGTFQFSLTAGPLHWRYFSFIDVAGLDFFLFVVLLLITIWAQIIEVRAHRDGTFISSWLREECATLRAYTYLRSIGPDSKDDVPQWSVIVNKSIEQLQRTLGEVTELIRVLSAGLEDDRETVSKALKATDNLNAIYEAGRHVYEQLNATLPHIDSSFEHMADSQATAVRSLDSIATTMHKSATAIDELAKPFSTIGVAQLARDTFDSLQQVQAQQKRIQQIQGQHMDMLSQIDFPASQKSQKRWWGARLFHKIFAR